MKKLLFVVALMATMVCASCGNKVTSNSGSVNDTTKVDSLVSDSDSVATDSVAHVDSVKTVK